MRQDQIDTILAHDEELIPTSGFLLSVMERVEDEAAALPPIPFPWKRAVPGFLLAAVVLVWGAVEIVRYIFRDGVPHLAARQIQLSQSLTPAMRDVGWILAALAISATASLLARRLAGRSGLL
jgi:apolipoprotein N-acyltransferase